MGASMTYPSIVGKCDAIRNSKRRIANASLAFTADYSVTYTGGPDPGTVAISGSISKAWARLAFPQGVDHLLDQPGAGNFFMAEPGCCCPCRAIYAFDDRTLELVTLTAGAATAPATLSLLDRGEAGELDRVIAIQLWQASAPPCRKAGGVPGPFGAPRATASIPQDFFESLTDPSDGSIVDPMITVAGTHSPVDAGQSGVDIGSHLFDFTQPIPCSDDQTYSLSITSTWEGAQVSGSATVTFAFIFGP